jgi:CheY-like chemotaxis protein
MNESNSSPGIGPSRFMAPQMASELNNLLQMIAGTGTLLEGAMAGGPLDIAVKKHFELLRSSVQRAERIAAELVKQAGGSERKVVIHPDLFVFTRGLKPQPPPRPSQGTPSIHRIMVVDDEEVIGTLCARSLGDAGFEVTTVDSGFKCLQVFARSPKDFHLVLLDLTMPGMTGEETFDRLREISKDVPVVVTTGFADKERLKGMMARGLAGYLRKPYGPAEMIMYVRAIIESFQFARPVGT